MERHHGYRHPILVGARDLFDVVFRIRDARELANVFLFFRFNRMWIRVNHFFLLERKSSMVISQWETRRGLGKEVFGFLAKKNGQPGV